MLRKVYNKITLLTDTHLFCSSTVEYVERLHGTSVEDSCMDIHLLDLSSSASAQHWTKPYTTTTILYKDADCYRYRMYGVTWTKPCHALAVLADYAMHNWLRICENVPQEQKIRLSFFLNIDLHSPENDTTYFLKSESELS